MKPKINTDFAQRVESEFSGNKYERLNLKFNPFPVSGSTYIHSSDELTSYLEPVEESVRKNIFDFIISSLKKQTHTDDNYQGMTILGEYGSGKTQLLMYLKFLLESTKIPEKKPYVIYIDNPGVKISELISAIIAEIGHANLKKYLWKFVINKLSENKESFYTDLGLNKSLLLTEDPFDDSKNNSYKLFIESCKKSTLNKSTNKSDFNDKWKNLLISVLKDKQINGKEDGFIAQEFFNILDDDLGVSSTWDNLLYSQKTIEKREVNFINAIISLLHCEGFTNVFMLIDEFEDITRGRLTKLQVDNYLYSLRTLLDKERRWSVVFAMTSNAFDKLKNEVPPLAERMTTIKTQLQSDLTDEQVKKLVLNYISFAQIEDKGLFPFSVESIAEINQRKEKNARRILSFCSQVIEKALELEESQLPISKEFITQLQ
jgi:hypothetical protein